MSGEDETDQRRPFIEASSSSSNVIQEPPRRTGDVVSAVAHIITGVIGAGVLSLAWSIAQLGWIAGPLCILIFAAATAVSSSLLSDCYCFPHPHGPVRNPSLMHAVKLYLGGKREVFCGVLVKIYLVGTSTAYVITSASSARRASSILDTAVCHEHPATIEPSSPVSSSLSHLHHIQQQPLPVLAFQFQQCIALYDRYLHSSSNVSGDASTDFGFLIPPPPSTTILIFLLSDASTDFGFVIARLSGTTEHLLPRGSQAPSFTSVLLFWLILRF